MKPKKKPVKKEGALQKLQRRRKELLKEKRNKDLANGYFVIHEPTTEAMADAVGAARLEGWVPQGGLAASNYGIFQAMVLPDDV